MDLTDIHGSVWCGR